MRNDTTTLARACFINNFTHIPIVNSITPITDNKYLTAGLEVGRHRNCYHISDINNTTYACEKYFNLNVIIQPKSYTGNNFNGFVAYDNGSCNWYQYPNMTTSERYVNCYQ